jgi:hypothetical protein
MIRKLKHAGAQGEKKTLSLPTDVRQYTCEELDMLLGEAYLGQGTCETHEADGTQSRLPVRPLHQSA